MVAFFGGMALGAVMQGFPLTHEPGTVPTYVGGALRFISPFSIWTGISSVIAVTLGGVLFVREPSSNATFELVFPGGPWFTGSHTGTVTVTVAGQPGGTVPAPAGGTASASTAANLT